MNTAERVAALRAEADALQAVGEAEVASQLAKEAYREDPTEENKEAHQAAALRLREARQVGREARQDISAGDGGAVVAPAPVRARRGA